MSDQIKDRIRKQRLMVGLTQTQLAKLIGCRNETVSLWERGEQEPERYLKDLAQALGVSMDWLERGGGEATAQEIVHPEADRDVDREILIRLAEKIDVSRDEMKYLRGYLEGAWGYRDISVEHLRGVLEQHRRDAQGKPRRTASPREDSARDAEANRVQREAEERLRQTGGRKLSPKKKR